MTDKLAEAALALRKYGQHKTTCPAYRSHQTGVVKGGFKDLKDPNSYTEECNCGFDDTLRAALEAEPVPGQFELRGKATLLVRVLLEKHATKLRAIIDDPNSDEDQVADASNDLGFTEGLLKAMRSVAGGAVPDHCGLYHDRPVEKGRELSRRPMVAGGGWAASLSEADAQRLDNVRRTLAPFVYSDTFNFLLRLLDTAHARIAELQRINRNIDLARLRLLSERDALQAQLAERYKE